MSPWPGEHRGDAGRRAFLEGLLGGDHIEDAARRPQPQPVARLAPQRAERHAPRHARRAPPGAGPACAAAGVDAVLAATPASSAPPTTPRGLQKSPAIAFHRLLHCALFLGRHRRLPSRQPSAPRSIAQSPPGRPLSAEGDAS